MVALQLAKDVGHTEAEPLHRAYCAMAFNNRGARWLQRKKFIMNPYWGDKMLHCGGVEEIYPAAVKKDAAKKAASDAKKDMKHEEKH